MPDTYNSNALSGKIEQTGSPENDSSTRYLPFIAKVSNENIIKNLIEKIHNENKAQYGWLGNFFGTEKNASKNITFVILFLIIAIYIILIFWVNEEKTNSQSFALNTLEKLLPLFTLSFGYFFGKQ